MFLWAEVEAARRAPARDFDIARFVFAIRNVIGGEVGERGEPVLQCRQLRAFGFLLGGKGGLQFGDFGLQRLGLVLVALRHRLPDQLRRLVAARERCLNLGLQRAQRRVGGKNIGGQGVEAAAREAGIEGLRVIPDQADIVHGGAMALRGARRKPDFT